LGVIKKININISLIISNYLTDFKINKTEN
jgi:hypothetical protein